MAERRRWRWQERQELHSHLHFCRSPSTSPAEYFMKVAILCFLDGIDAQAELEKYVPAFQAAVHVQKARTWIGNERAKRRSQAGRILAERDRLKIANQFTHDNFRVTIDPHQNRNYGMVNSSIYCVVEVWQEEESHDAEKEYLVNFSDYKTKEWLVRLLVWALMNKREVHIIPATEAQLSSMRMFVPKE